VALQYGEHDAVPRIVSSGAGDVARAIIELARASGVPLRHDPELAEMLSQIPVGSNITPETYRLVAEVISFLYHVDGEFRAKHPRIGAVIGAPQPALPTSESFQIDPPLELGGGAVDLDKP
jgi:flagellar biosynthesis protein